MTCYTDKLRKNRIHGSVLDSPMPVVEYINLVYHKVMCLVLPYIFQNRVEYRVIFSVYPSIKRNVGYFAWYCQDIVYHIAMCLTF